jgi:hypothetical protein
MHSKWVSKRQQNVLHLSHKLEGGGGIVANQIYEGDIHWKVVDASFEEALNLDVNLQRFIEKMFFVWDNNHRL